MFGGFVAIYKSFDIFKLLPVDHVKMTGRPTKLHQIRKGGSVNGIACLYRFLFVAWNSSNVLTRYELSDCTEVDTIQLDRVSSIVDIASTQEHLYVLAQSSPHKMIWCLLIVDADGNKVKSWQVGIVVRRKGYRLIVSFERRQVGAAVCYLKVVCSTCSYRF